MNKGEFESYLKGFNIPKKLWNLLWNYYANGVNPKDAFLQGILMCQLRIAMHGLHEHGFSPEDLVNTYKFCVQHLPNEAIGSAHELNSWQGVNHGA